MMKKSIKDLPLEETPLGGQARTLVNNPQLRLVNLVLGAGEQVAAHSAPVDVVFVALEGRGILKVESEELDLLGGQMMICPAHLTRSITASAEEGLGLLVVRAPNL